MRGWLLDTNVIAELSRTKPDPKVASWASRQTEADLYISVLTLAEYDKGLHNLPAGAVARGRIAASIVALEARFAGRILSVDDATVRRWGLISGTVQRLTGRAPPVIDTLLAATAIERALWLVTRNVKDVQDTGAALFDPWHDDPGGA